MKKKNIIHISYSDYVGGASIAARNIHKSLENKVNSVFMCNEKKNKKKNLFDKIFLSIRIFIGRLPKIFYLNKSGTNYSFAFLPSKYPKVLNKTNDQNKIIHLHWINRETISIEDIKKINAKILWTCHDMWPFLGARHIANNKINYKKIKNIFRFLNLDYLTWRRKKNLFEEKKISFVVPSNWMKNQLKESDSYNKNKIFVIGNPIDCDFWKKTRGKNIFKKFNLKNNTFKIVFGAGGVSKDKNKGLDLALNIFEKLNKLKSIKFEVLFFGDNVNFIKNKYNFNFIDFGWVNKKKLKEIFSLSDLMICTSKIESFCQTAAEAQSCSVPVISYKTSGLNDVIKNNYSGILIEDYNDQKFIEKIISLIKNKNKRLKFSKNSRKHIKKNFDKKIISKKYLNAYNQL